MITNNSSYGRIRLVPDGIRGGKKEVYNELARPLGIKLEETGLIGEWNSGRTSPIFSMDIGDGTFSIPFASFNYIGGSRALNPLGIKTINSGTSLFGNILLNGRNFANPGERSQIEKLEEIMFAISLTPDEITRTVSAVLFANVQGKSLLFDTPGDIYNQFLRSYLKQEDFDTVSYIVSERDRKIRELAENLAREFNLHIEFPRRSYVKELRDTARDQRGLEGINWVSEYISGVKKNTNRTLVIEDASELIVAVLTEQVLRKQYGQKTSIGGVYTFNLDLLQNGANVEHPYFATPEMYRTNNDVLKQRIPSETIRKRVNDIVTEICNSYMDSLRDSGTELLVIENGLGYGILKPNRG